MDRREFLRTATIATAALAAGSRGGDAMAARRKVAAATPAAAKGKVIDVVEAGVADLQSAMQNGTTTSRDLVRAYVARIRAIDKDKAGPRINAIIELNPDAASIAAALDRERKAKGPRGPLHGVPVLIKDNIATADAMQTTAGSLALVGVKPPRDATIVTRLRDAGAVILGKTNLSEWANIRSTRSTSGWSARGGLTRNP
jgi:amidase